MTSKVPLWERCFVILTFITSCRGFDNLFSSVNNGGGGRLELNESSPARFTWLAMLYGIALMLLIYHHRRDVIRLLSQNKLLVVIVVYVMLSTFWAYDPNTTFRRSTAFALTATFCAYVTLRYTPTEILKLAGWAILCVAVASLFTVIFFPALGREEFGRKLGWWRGVSCINTAFGRFMALGLLIIWCLRRTDWRLQKFDVLVFALFLLSTYQAHAATSIAAVFAAYASILFIWSRTVFNVELPPKIMIGALMAVVLLLTVPFYFSDVLMLLDRDDTLTNRIFIWRAAYEQGWQNPFFGVGYESFWIEGNAAVAYYNMFGSGGTQVGNGHNGYLDAWLEMGFVGLGLAFLIMSQGLIRVIRYLTVKDEPFAEFFGSLLVFILIYSIAEKVIFVHSEFTWMLFMTGLMTLRWRLDPATEASKELAGEWDGVLPPLPQRAP